MSEYMVKYMQKLFYEGLKDNDKLKANMALEWFNNGGVFIEDKGNLLCKDCPLKDCLECKDRISKADYLDDMSYNELEYGAEECIYDCGFVCDDCKECKE